MAVTTKAENLKREIGAMAMAMSCVNLMVGTGIFALPALVAEGLGATAILAYLVCGSLVFLLALCFAELGSKTTISGGPYTYIEKAFGPYAGFLAGNLYLFGSMASDAALANALSDVLQYFIPVLRMDMYRIVSQFLLFGGLAWLNIGSVKSGVRFAVFAGIGKLIPLLLLVVIAIPHIEAANLKWIVDPTANNIGSASLLLFFAFMGLETSLCNGGEIKNPARTVPLGLFGGVAIVSILYLSIQLVTQGILGDSLGTFKEAPLAAVANISMGKIGVIFIIAVTSISIIGSLSGEILSMPRILFAAARDGLMPAALAKVHRRFTTPHISILVYAGIGFLMAISGGFKQLAIIASAALLIIYLGVAFATIRLRKGEAAVSGSKTFRVAGGSVIPLTAAAGILWLLSNSSKTEVIGICVFTAVFSAIYLGVVVFKKKKNK
jgi:amino acid transporter